MPCRMFWLLLFFCYQLSADQIRSDDIRVNSDESVSLAEIVSVGQKTSKLYHETDPGVARNGHQKMNIMTSRADHHRSDMYNLPVGEDDFTNKISKYDWLFVNIFDANCGE
jgi:hypothetical protein